MKAAAGGGTGLGTGGGTSNDQGTKFAPGSVPQRPSQGQVAGAIGSVMPGAKACLGGDDPMSRATVTFQSDGTVKSVSVSGLRRGQASGSVHQGRAVQGEGRSVRRGDVPGPGVDSLELSCQPQLSALSRQPSA